MRQNFDAVTLAAPTALILLIVLCVPWLYGDKYLINYFANLMYLPRLSIAPKHLFEIIITFGQT